jgi:hypothetical protein
MRISKLPLIFLLASVSLSFAQGALNIRSNPSGAAVYVNNSYIGDAPLLYDVPTGNYQVRLELAGFTPFASQVQVLGDEVITVAGQLLASSSGMSGNNMSGAAGSASGTSGMSGGAQEVAVERVQTAPQAYGTARVASPYTGAIVIINGNTVGVVPNGGVLTVRRVPVGQHVLRLEVSSQQFFEQAFNIAADQMTNVVADGSGMASVTPANRPVNAAMNAPITNRTSMNMANPRVQPGSVLSNPSNARVTSQTMGNVSGIVGAGRMTSLAGPFGGLGDVLIDSNPRAVQVFIDGRYLGITPMNPIPLEPGVHQLRFIAPGLGETIVQVNVVPGETQNVFVDLLQ